MTALGRMTGTGWPGVCALCALILMSGCRRKPGAESESGELADTPIVGDFVPWCERPGHESPPTPQFGTTHEPESFLNVYFNFDEGRVPANQIDRLDFNLTRMKEHPDDKVLIEGHADERGTTEYNFHLGMRRATAVRDYLMKHGIDPARLATMSRGEEHPADRAHAEDAWAQNRRVEFLRFR